MSYYKMKCAYCARTLTNSDIVYKLATEELCNQIKGSSKSDSTTESNAPDVMEGMSENTSIGDSGGDGDYISGEVLEKENHAVPIYEEVKISRKHKEMEGSEHSFTFPGNLCVGYMVENLNVNNTIYAYAELKKRRCRFCKKPLPKLSGTMPTFLIMMAGHSTAGKTTFLLGQRIIFGGDNFNIIGGVVYPEIQGNTEDGVCHFEGKEEDFIETTYMDYLMKKTFPATTTDMPAPHCVKFGYRRNGNDANGHKILTYQSECLVIFQDVMGEKFVVNHDEVKKEMIEKAKLADSYIIAMDSTILMGEIPGISKDTGDPKFLLKEMKNTFVQYGKEKVKKPSVVALTKTDEILKHQLDLHLPGVDETTPVLNAGMTFNGEDPAWKKKFLDKMDEGTIDLLEKLQQNDVGNWHGMLEEQFPSAKYMSVTVYGDHAEVVKVKNDNNNDDNNDDKIVENAEPRHTEAPILYLLMELGVLPPMQKASFADNYEEEYERWYDEYCQDPILPEQRLFKVEDKQSWFSSLFKRKKKKK